MCKNMFVLNTKDTKSGSSLKVHKENQIEYVAS